MLTAGLNLQPHTYVLPVAKGLRICIWDDRWINLEIKVPYLNLRIQQHPLM